MKTYKKIFVLLFVSLFMLSAQVQAASGNDLRKAAKSGDLPMVKQMLEQGVNPDSQGNGGGTALHKAAKQGHLEIVQLLLFHGANPVLKNKKGRTALEVAESNEEREIVDVMQASIRPQEMVVRINKNEFKFKDTVTRVLLGRRWVIESLENERITANYNRSGRNYKVRVELNGRVVTIGFVKGYGAKKINYLNNIKVDLEKII